MAGGATAAAASSHSLTWWRLAAIAFVFTSCGPFGMEAAVLSGGAKLTMISIFVTPLVYVIPQVLMVSELAGMMPDNRGHIAWVERGWGRAAGAFNAYNALLTNSIDLSLYPVLGGNYFVAHFYRGASSVEIFVVRTVMVLVGLAIAVRSAKMVSDAAVTISIIIIVPFLVFFFAAATKISPSTQWTDQPLGPSDKVDWAAFSAASLWLYTGWNSLGALGGDVDDESNRKLFIRGLSAALVFDILLYFLPLMAALTVPGGTWEDGYLTTCFNLLMPGAGIVVSCCGLLSTMGLFVSSLACYARLLWGMADVGWLPAILAKTDPESHSPVNATIAQIVAILPLLLFSFSYLQRIEFVVASVSYILTFTAFLRLRYTEPDAPRPFRVGGGMPVAWLITATKVLVFVFILVTNFDDSSLIGGAVLINSTIALVYWYVNRNAPDMAAAPGVIAHGVPSVSAAAALAAQKGSDDGSSSISTDGGQGGETSPAACIPSAAAAALHHHHQHRSHGGAAEATSAAGGSHDLLMLMPGRGAAVAAAVADAEDELVAPVTPAATPMPLLGGGASSSSSAAGVEFEMQHR